MDKRQYMDLQGQDLAWEAFLATGRLEYYLLYRELHDANGEQEPLRH